MSGEVRVYSTGSYAGVNTLPETTGTLLVVVCHVQVSHSPPPSSDSTTRPGHVIVHVHSRAMRVCRDQVAMDEDIPIQMIDIYVQ